MVHDNRNKFCGSVLMRQGELTSFKDLNKPAPGPFFHTPPMAVSALASTDQYPAFSHARVDINHSSNLGATHTGGQYEDVHEPLYMVVVQAGANSICCTLRMVMMQA